MAADGPLEIQSFVSKFLHLSSLGCLANLAINFDGDNIQVNLQASIKKAYVSAEPVHNEKSPEVLNHLEYDAETEDEDEKLKCVKIQILVREFKN